MTEIWRDIPGYEGFYQISSYGRVRSLARKGCQGKVLMPYIWQKNGRKSPCKYYCIRLGKDGRRRSCKVHRLVAMAFLGLQSSDMHVDHINHNTLDNKLSNLRLCSNTENHHNMKRRATSTSPYKGITYDKTNRRWRARITAFGKRIWLGRFDTSEEAHAAYVEASKRYHGEFARPD